MESETTKSTERNEVECRRRGKSPARPRPSFSILALYFSLSLALYFSLSLSLSLDSRCLEICMSQSPVGGLSR